MRNPALALPPLCVHEIPCARQTVVLREGILRAPRRKRAASDDDDGQRRAARVKPLGVGRADAQCGRERQAQPALAFTRLDGEPQEAPAPHRRRHRGDAAHPRALDARNHLHDQRPVGSTEADTRGHDDGARGRGRQSRRGVHQRCDKAGHVVSGRPEHVPWRVLGARQSRPITCVVVVVVADGVVFVIVHSRIRCGGQSAARTRSGPLAHAARHVRRLGCADSARTGRPPARHGSNEITTKENRDKDGGRIGSCTKREDRAGRNDTEDANGKEEQRNKKKKRRRVTQRPERRDAGAGWPPFRLIFLFFLCVAHIQSEPSNEAQAKAAGATECPNARRSSRRAAARSRRSSVLVVCVAFPIFFLFFLTKQFALLHFWSDRLLAQQSPRQRNLRISFLSGVLGKGSQKKRPSAAQV